MDNYESIKKAYAYCQKKGYLLYAKFHPAENNTKEIERIISLQKEIDFHLTNVNTVDLIKSSKEIIVINSTVGLEAMIFGKPVQIYGRCHYHKFDSSSLNKYIHSYLIDGVDYFSQQSIDKKIFSRIVPF